MMMGVVKRTQLMNSGILSVSGKPMTRDKAPVAKAAFFLSHFSASIKGSAAASKSDTADVMEANATSKKNSVPNSVPAGIRGNRPGKVINNSGIPAPGATPKAKAAGKMMRAARIAAEVSKIAVYAAAQGTSSSLCW